jgi:hypothetical protein
MLLGKKYKKSQILEKKIAILDKGIAENPGSEKLILHLLKYRNKEIEFAISIFRSGQQLWERKKLFQAWRHALKLNPYLPEIWEEYIEVVQTNFSSFSVHTMREIYR